LTAIRYHEATKHHFNRFARSLGYLDWATQPDPFRRYHGAATRELPRAPLAVDVPYAALYSPPSQRFGEAGDRVAPQPIDDHSIGEFLRCSMGLSAWKQYGSSRWALRVNPSSGNLHPTEAWIVHDGRVGHYAPREHALEERCVFDPRTSNVVAAGDFFLVALTSIIWREAWKYGERGFRYCQHDAGHAIGALRFAAAMLGWRMRLQRHWSDAQVATLLGLDRDADYDGAEREDPECIALVSSQPGFGIRDSGFDPELRDSGFDPELLVEAARGGAWRGRANRLSSNRVDWPIIDEVAEATRYPGSGFGIRDSRFDRLPTADPRRSDTGPLARQIILQRRSALAFNPRGVLQRAAFLSMLARLRTPAPPWDVIDWPPHVHLVLFVHRVQDMTPGIYACLRDPAVLDEWKSSMRPEFLWEPVEPGDPANLFLLVPIEAGRIANRLSCDQEIAEDGFFALSMLARFEGALRERGEWFYRRLFWECGLVGQVLYLEAEAAGARATGIGCYYDDPVHELLGLSGHEWQSLYHFSMGLPVEDTRLTSEPGYDWERHIPTSNSQFPTPKELNSQLPIPNSQGALSRGNELFAIWPSTPKEP
jgi:SagB-type dehydrogenase family enzyme